MIVGRKCEEVNHAKTTIVIFITNPFCLEMRLGEWYQGDDKLILGTCCELKTGDSVVRCYIQEFVKGNEQCVVYIPSTAERRTVRYTDLSPETNAKPWPLPYR